MFIENLQKFVQNVLGVCSRACVAPRIAAPVVSTYIGA